MKKIFKYLLLSFVLVSFVTVLGSCDKDKNSSSSSNVSSSSSSSSVAIPSPIDDLTIPETIDAAYVLPTTYNDCELTWDADVENFVSHTNIVRPSHAGDMTVDLVATTVKENQYFVKEFTVYFEQQVAASTVNESFDDYCDQLFVDTLKGDPFTINFTLKYPENFGLENETLESEPADITVQGIIDDLKEFDYTSLTLTQQIIYDTLYYSCEESLITEGYEDYMTSLGSYLGYNAYITSSLAEYHFYDEHDVTNFLDYIKAIKSDFEEIIAFENTKLEKGCALPDFILDGVISQCEAVLEAEDDCCLITIFEDTISAVEFLDDTEKASYIAQNKSLVENDYMEAYEYLLAEVKKLKDANEGANELGLAKFENGADYYEALFQQSCGTTMTCEELITYLEAKMKTSLKNLESAAKLISSNAGLYKKYTSLDLMGDLTLEGILPYIQTKMTEDFPSVGEIDYKIQEVPTALQENSSPAYYFSSVVDADVTESIYINPVDCTPESDSDYDTKNYLFTTLCHEGIPGHMYQNIYYKNSPYFSHVLATQSFTAYTEGWATYVEKYVWKYTEAGTTITNYSVENDNYSYLAYCRADVGINYEGWDANDVEDFFTDAGFSLSDGAGEDILEFLVEVPTNYLTYYFGYYQIMDLKTYAQEKLGSSFTETGFHKAILDFGPAPWSVVKSSVDLYIASTLASK